jgi:gluconolactonase
VHPSLLVAEAGVESDGGPVPGMATYCEVREIVNTRCMPCHADPPTAGASRTLATYAATQEIGTGGIVVYQIMATRMGSTVAPMPPLQAPRATDEEIATVSEWAMRNAPPCDDNPQRDGGVIGPPRDGGDIGPPRDGGPPRDAGPVRDGGPGRDGGPIDPLSFVGPAVQLTGGSFMQVAGALWFPAQNRMLFADPVGNTVWQGAPPNYDLTNFRAGAMGTNGLDVDPDGNLVIAEWGGRRIARLEGTNYVTVVDTYQGMRLNSPNDVAVRSDGVIYFSDPDFGLVGPREIPFNGVFSYVATATDSAPVRAELQRTLDRLPSGVELSADETRLYVSDVSTGEIVVMDVLPNGRLANERLFAAGTAPIDGIAVDVWENVYVGESNGAVVYDSTGTMLGTVNGVAGPVNRVAWGGPTLETLFITTGPAIFRVEISAGGVR